MKAKRKQPIAKKTPAKGDIKLDRKKIRAELYKPENIEKARRMERGPIV